MEKEVTLADRVIQMTHDWRHVVGANHKRIDKLFAPSMLKLRKSMRLAERFILDDAFTSQAVRKASTQPEHLLRMSEFASLPFDRIWIEFNQNLRVDIQAAMGTSKPRVEDIGHAGFLIERTDHGPSSWIATWFQGLAEHRPEAYLGQVSYAFAREIDMWQYCGLKGDEEPMGKRDWMQYWKMGWGYSGNLPSSEVTQQAYARLLHLGGAVPFTLWHKPLIEAKVINIQDFYASAQSFAYEGRGDLRFIVTLLAMINLVPITYVFKPSTGSYQHRLKHMDYLSHRRVTIRVGKGRVETIVDKAMSAEAMRRKRHKVRGHFRVYHRGQTNQMIKWIEAHERGDASLGFVTHDYQVTAGESANATRPHQAQ